MSKIDTTSYFNNLPIRIIGTTQEPFFYASDIGKILGIGNISRYIVKFDEIEIVSPEKRRKYNLVTYQKYKDNIQENHRMILLTEYGVYRLIVNSRKKYALELKVHVYNLIMRIRYGKKIA